MLDRIKKILEVAKAIIEIILALVLIYAAIRGLG